jgi:hypothetical protein
MRLVDPPTEDHDAYDGYNTFTKTHPANDFTAGWLAPFEKPTSYHLPGPRANSGNLSGGKGSGGNFEPFRDFKKESHMKQERSGSFGRNGVLEEGRREPEKKDLASLYRPPFEICFNDTYEKVFFSRCFILFIFLIFSF